jgi:hypothetical protein
LAPFLARAQAATLGIDLLGRLLADVTGVEDDQIGVVGLSGDRIAQRRQHIAHALRIVDVHLAAVRLDKEALRRAGIRHGYFLPALALSSSGTP